MDQSEKKTDSSELQRQADLARRLLEDARKNAITPPGTVPPLPDQAIRTITTMSADKRLAVVNSFVAEAIDKFASWDTTDNFFLGKHELTAAGTTGSAFLLSNFDSILPLHNDRGRRIDTNHLGISRADLRILNGITGSPADFNLLVRERAWRSGIAQTFTIGGFLAGTMGVALGAGAAYGISLKSAAGFGLGGLAIGAGIVGAGYYLGYLAQKSELEAIRSRIGADQSVDLLIRTRRP